MTVTVAQDGQITLTPETVARLGFVPGQELTIAELPQGGGALHAVTSAALPPGMSQQGKPEWTPEELARIEAVIGCLKTDRIVSIEEMNETIAKGWAGLLGDNNDDA